MFGEDERKSYDLDGVMEPGEPLETPEMDEGLSDLPEAVAMPLTTWGNMLPFGPRPSHVPIEEEPSIAELEQELFDEATDYLSMN